MSVGQINWILLTIFALVLIDYYLIKKGDYRKIRFFWPVLVALNLIFVLLTIPNLILS